MKLEFEYGHGLMAAELPDNTDVFIPGVTVPDPECLPQDWDSLYNATLESIRNPYGMPALKELSAQMRAVIAEHKLLPTRPQSIAWRILLRHTEFCERLAEIMSEKCVGHTKYALELFDQFKCDFGKYDVEMERWLDYSLCFQSLYIMIKQLPKIEL